MMNLALCTSVTALILTFFQAAVTFLNLCGSSVPEIYSRLPGNKIFNFQLAAEAVLVVLSVLSLADVAGLGVCLSVILGCMGSSTIFLVLDFCGNIVPQRYKGLFSFVTKTLTVVLMLELTLFNFNTYDFLSGGYEQTEVDFSKVSVVNGNLNTDKSVTLNGGSIELENVGIPVGSISVNVSTEFSSSVDFKLRYADETNAQYRAAPAEFSVIKNNRRSATVPLAFSGKVSKLMLSYTKPSGQENSINIKSVTLNKPVELEFNLLRIVTILFFAVLCYLLLNADVFRKPVKNSGHNMKAAALVLSVIFVYTAFVSITLYRNDNQASLEEEFSLSSGNQITRELVDAFEKGNAELDIQADSSLTSLENPYDWSQREEHNVVYSWDHVFYNGKYYSYYGIAPVILLFIPYHLITGYYFPTVWAVMLFGSIGIVFLIKLLKAILERWFGEIPFGFAVSAMVIILCSCGVWANFVTPNFYEISQTSGFAFVTAGAYFMITSEIISDDKNINCTKLAIATSLLALAVLCRPTLAVYCMAALLFIAFGFLKIKKQFSADTSKKKKDSKKGDMYIKYFSCALIPFVVIGSIQMYYNYVRFGSFTDFGIDYSLTINDFTRAESHISQIFIGFFNFLFAMPLVDTVFPFIHSNFTKLDTNGYYFVANTIACGIIFKALPSLSYLYAGKAYSLSSINSRRRNLILILAVSVIAPFMIIFSIAESGYGVRYATDFDWQIVTGAFIIAFTVYSSIKNDAVKRILGKLLVFSVVLSIVVFFAQLYEHHLVNVRTVQLHAGFMNLARCFEFWK
ncbi:MAG: hypothetical protein II501_00045 [Clostridia bacterium]|nr:hypothetical protein [Clostridia bacterium]